MQGSAKITVQPNPVSPAASGRDSERNRTTIHSSPARQPNLNPWSTISPPTDEISSTETALALYGPPNETHPLALIDEDPATTDLACIDDLEPQQPDELEAARSGGWTLAVLCIGLAILAACMIIPQADANRRLVYEHAQLRQDLAQIQKQIQVNQRFLSDVAVDPQLAERLAVRQMRVVPQGERVLDLGSDTGAGGKSIHTFSPDQAEQMSPFGMLTIPPPPALLPYRPVGGVLAALCRDPQSRLFLLTIALFLTAAGLILGTPAKPTPAAHSHELNS